MSKQPSIQMSSNVSPLSAELRGALWLSQATHKRCDLGVVAPQPLDFAVKHVPLAMKKAQSDQEKGDPPGI